MKANVSVHASLALLPCATFSVKADVSGLGNINFVLNHIGKPSFFSLADIYVSTGSLMTFGSQEMVMNSIEQFHSLVSAF